MNKLFRLPDGTDVHLLEVATISPLHNNAKGKFYIIGMSNKEFYNVFDKDLSRSKFMKAFESNNSFLFKLKRVFTHGTWG